MAKSKRILSVILSVLLVLTVVPMGMFSATAASVDNGTGKLVIPTVTLTSTPVLRIANSSTPLEPGNTLVAATPSGLAQISGSYTAQYYAGETPAFPVVTLTSDKALTGNPTISCSVTGVQFEGPTKSGNTYTWTVKNGSASFTAGSDVFFTVDYQYQYTDSLTGRTITNTYKAYAASCAESVAQPAGAEMYRERSATWTLHEREHSDMVYRIVGANTYGAMYAENGSLNCGYVNFVGLGFTGKDHTNYAQVYNSSVKDGDDGSKYFLTAVDGNRPVATTYIDRNGGTPALSNNNLRLAVFQAQNRSEYTHVFTSLKVIPGVSAYAEGTAHNNTAGNQIGLAEVNSQISMTGPGNNGGYGHLTFPMTGNTYGEAATADANGNLVSSYTLIPRGGTLHTVASNRQSFSAVGLSLVINSYDKSELRSYVNDLFRENDPLTKPAVGSAIGLNPQEQWYSAGWSNYLAAFKTALAVLAKPRTNQNEIDQTYANLQQKVSQLVVKEADHTAYDLAIARFQACNMSDYTVASWNEVLNKYDAAVATQSYSVFYQNAVDKAVDELNYALDHLVPAPANWERVEDAVLYYEELMPDYQNYTAEAWAAVRDAVETALEAQASGDYDITDQEYVDALAKAIEDAIDYLRFNRDALALADYTAYDAQVARYNNVVLTEKAQLEAALAQAGIDLAAMGVTNVYKAVSWNRMQANLNLDRTYKYDEQDVVDDATEMLRQAIDTRQFADAIYTDVDAALEEAGEVNYDWYTEESLAVLDEAIEAVVEGKKINEQVTVNGYAAAIRAAIANLIEADADYSEYERLCEVADGLNPAIYTEASYNAVFDAISAVNPSYTAQYQSALNVEVAAIQTAIDNLEYLPASYTRVDAAISNWENNYKPNSSNYTPASVANVVNAINNVDRTKNITQQAEVTAMAVAIENAINALEERLADYTNLKFEYERAKNFVQTQTTYAAEHDGYSYYLPEKYEALTAVIATLDVVDGEIVENKTISQQAEVTALYTSLKAANDALELNIADYSELIAALATVPSEEDLEQLYTEGSAIAVFVAALEGQTAVEAQDYTVDQQAEVDALTEAVEDAVANLQYKSADYDTLVTLLDSIPADLSIYTNESVAALTAAMEDIPFDSTGNLIMDKTILEQEIVDGWVTAIENALPLVEDYANYDDVDAAIADWNNNYSYKSSQYTTESVTRVTNAINAVVRGKYAKDQQLVNEMADAINEAIRNLEERSLDLTTYNVAVAMMPTDRSIYTEASLAVMDQKLQDAQVFIMLYNKFSNQAAFEDAVTALVVAISNLEPKLADYGFVESYTQEANALNRDDYYDFSNVDAAIEAVVPDLDYTHQEEVDAMAQAIRDAIDSLEEKPLDLAAYNAAVDRIPTDLSIYTNEYVEALTSAKTAADSFIETSNKRSKQEAFNSLVDNLVYLIEHPEIKAADYTELDELVERALGFDPADFTNYFEVYFIYITPYINDVIPQNRDYLITEQSEVDAMRDTLQSYIDMLDANPADYTAVNAKVQEANTEIAKDIYTADSVAALQAIIDGIDYSYDALHQAEVDAYVPALEAGITALEVRPADYTELDALLAYVEYINANGMDPDGKVFTNFMEIYWTYLVEFIPRSRSVENRSFDALHQSEVDTLTAELQGYIDMLTEETEEPPAPTETFEFINGAEYFERSGVKYVRGLKTLLTRGQLLNNYINAENVTVNVQIASGTRYLGTGSVITVTSDATGEVIDQYIIIIYGDVNRNGSIDASDVLYLNDVIGGKEEMTSVEQSLAANVFGTRATVDAQDLSVISSITLGEGTINQLTGKAE